MNRIAGILMAALLPLSGSGGPGFRALVPEIVGAAREHAVHSSRPGSITGPVLLDAASFAAAGRSLGTPLDERSVVQAAGGEARAVAAGQGVVCAEASATHRRRCQVSERGVLLSVQSAERTAAGLEVVVSARWTDERPSGAVAVAGHTLRLTFSPQGERWRLAGTAVLRRS
jgi:hypothetical protein